MFVLKPFTILYSFAIMFLPSVKITSIKTFCLERFNEFPETHVTFNTILGNFVRIDFRLLF